MGAVEATTFWERYQVTARDSSIGPTIGPRVKSSVLRLRRVSQSVSKLGEVARDWRRGPTLHN